MRFLVALLIALVFSIPVYGKVLCKGEGISVTEKEVEVFKSSIFRGFNITDKKACQMILKDKLLAKEAVSSGLQKREDVKLKLELLRIRILAKAYMDSIGDKIRISDEEIRDFYEKNKEKFREPVRIRVVEYRFKKEGDAKAFLAGKLKVKGRDMGYLVPLQIALLYSPVSRDVMEGKKGFIGPFKKGKEFLVLEVKERKGGSISPLNDELKEKIRRIIKSSKEREILEDLVEKLKKKYGVSCTF